MTPFTPEQLDELEKAARAAFVILHPWYSWDDFESRRKARGGLHPWQTQAFEIADAILALAGKGDDWRPIETAPQTGKIEVFAPADHGLPDLLAIAEWHPDAGFCVCEFRNATHWRPHRPPPPPKATSEEWEG